MNDRSTHDPDARPAITVLMLDGETALAFKVLRCLGEAPQVRVHVLSRQADPIIRHSRWCHGFHHAPPGDLLPFVHSLLSRFPIDVLLPCHDDGFAFLAEHRAELAPLVKLHPVSSLEMHQTCRDKWAFAQFLTRHGIPGPPTALSGSDCSALDPALPVLVKPTDGGDGALHPPVPEPRRCRRVPPTLASARRRDLAELRPRP